MRTSTGKTRRGTAPATAADKTVEQSFGLAREAYSALGVGVNSALDVLASVPISMHCWQGDDVGGFESAGAELGGGLAVTGNYPGKARTADELRTDLEKAYSLIPGKHRLNLHAMYCETGGKKVERNKLEARHFARWMDWAKSQRIGLDFNPTCFAHPKAADGLTLTHPDEGIRRYWIEHAAACRRIGAAFGQALGKPCVTNLWIPDGSKDVPADRKGPRERLKSSLDEIFAEPMDPSLNLDSLEGKLFGIGSESYVPGSHEFYLAYAMANSKVLCLDAGHFHPTEMVADKISSVLTFLDEILLHVSRGVRWDSDHVVTLTDDLLAIAREIVCNGYLSRVHVGLDYFDASINRVAAWVIGMRNMLKALLIALLEPAALRRAEEDGDFTSRLALMEESRSLPWGAVWDYYCLRQNAPVGQTWLGVVKDYERRVLSKRSS